MQLFSLLALMLSVFGATYTAINAVRGHYNPIIAEAMKVAASKLDNIKRHRGANDEKMNAGYISNMEAAVRVWHWSAIVPIFAFCFFAFYMAYWMYNNDFDKKLEADQMQLCKCIIAVGGVLNFICLCLAIISYLVFRHNNNVLTDNNKCAVAQSVTAT